MKTTHLIAVSLLCAAICAGGCTKTVSLTIMNHTETARNLQLTVPDGTMPVGTVGPNGGTMMTKMKVNNSDLPAMCNLSAGAGASQSFTVTEDSPSAWWFHVTPEGKLVGPLGKHSEYIKDVDGGTIEMRSTPRTIVR